MDIQGFLDHVNDLSDLELAVLLSLVAQHHCLIKTPDVHLDDVASELAPVYDLPPESSLKLMTCTDCHRYLQPLIYHHQPGFFAICRLLCIGYTG